MAGMIAMWLRNPRHRFDLGDAALCAGCMCWWRTRKRASCSRWPSWRRPFRCWGFRRSLPRWRDVFARIWRWKDSCRRKGRLPRLSVAGMIYFALYPFGVRPHMPMAQLSLSAAARARFTALANLSGPTRFFGPPISTARQLRDQRAAWMHLLDKGPVLADVGQTPVPPPACRRTHASPCSIRNFRWRALAMAKPAPRYIQGYKAFAARHSWLKLLPLYWYSLYRVERSAAMRP